MAGTGTGVPVETHIANLTLNGALDSNNNQFGGNLTVYGDEIQGGVPPQNGRTYQNSTNLGAGGTSQTGVRTTTGIVSDGATAKTFVNLIVPNATQSFVAQFLVRCAVTTAAHVYESTRVAYYSLALARVAGGLTVVTLSSVDDAAIATVGGGQTLTFTIAAGTITGANTATQTVPLQITVTGSVTGTAEVEYLFNTLNGFGVPANVNLAAPTGVTVQ